MTRVYRIYNLKTNEWGQAGAFKFTPKVNLAKTWTRQTLGGHLALYKNSNMEIPDELQVVEFTLIETGRCLAKEYKNK